MGSEKNIDFKKELFNDKNVTAILSEAEINDCFDINSYLKNIDAIFERMK